MRNKYKINLRINAQEFKKKLKIKDGKDAVIDYEKLTQEVLPHIPIPEDGEDAEFTEEIKEEIVIAVIKNFKKGYDPKFKKEIEEAVSEAVKNIKPVIINQEGGRDWGAPFELPIKAGVNIIVTKDASGAYVISSSSAGWLTPIGIVNGVNAVFAVASEPSMVMADGMSRVAGFGYTYSGGNITMDIPPQDWIRYM